MEITKEVFENFIACPYKSYRRLRKEFGQKTEYEIISKKINDLYIADTFKKYFPKQNEMSEFPTRNYSLNDGHKILPRFNINFQNMVSCCTAERIAKHSDLGPFSYIPLQFVPKENLSKEDKLTLAFDGFILGNMQARFPSHGKIVHGKNFKIRRIELESHFPKIKGIIGEIKGFSSMEEAPPRIILKKHCQICEFKEFCRTTAVEKDNLSLLAGISAKEIADQNKKGIFTVTQYSYTFRPRRKFRKFYPFNLKALAIREKKIHIYGKPEVPIASVRIYFDVEGDPERVFYYLVGMIILDGATEEKLSFWADSEEKERDIFLQFFESLAAYSEFILYHYGSYEIKFIRKAQKVLGQDYAQLASKILDSSINILAIIYSNIFFPTYSNGLKDVGAYLSFEWSSKNASGIQSLAWRWQFELLHEQSYKDRLIAYNMDDCYALKQVSDFISRLGKNGSDNRQIVMVESLKKESTYKWGKVDFVLKDFDYVNNCAYFDYQREKVFVRTNKNLRGLNISRKLPRRQATRTNKKILIPVQTKCPQCKSRMYRHGSYSRRVFDLKFSKAGVKRWVTIYSTNRARCIECKKVITSEYPEGLQKYGHNLISWVMYQNVVGHQPFYRILSVLEDVFGLSLSGSTLQRFKRIAAEYYTDAYQEIINRIKQGSLIHVDETQVSFSGVKGYVWVFTNMEEVYFLYTPTREGEFLKELLGEFKGVLISDFYGAYCSPEWIQQKCLVHLIRDLNDDLRKNPFDEEYKKMVVDFSLLLRQIISTVDKYGLKKRNLGKHKKEVFYYFHNIFRQNYASELAQKYQKRFQKNEYTLFAFLDYNGIPWNNNNAEHAIKHFAIYRRTMKASGHITERGLKQYLVLLSIYQTCRYKGINFMKFLVSQEKDICRFRG